MGIGYFCHVFTPSFIEAGLLADAENEAAVGAINATITALAPVLNKQSVSNGVTVATTDSVPVDTMLKRHDGATYVFAVAMRGTTTSATFTLRGFPASATVFSDNFDGYGVHLYRITF